MLNVANNINEAWLRPSRQLETKITMNGEVYDNSSITSFSFDSGSISGESFQIGSAYMNQVQIIFPSVISTVNKDQEITIEVGILVDGTYHYSKLGKFIISEFDRNQNDKTTTITAVDQMILLEGPYVSKLSYPARIRDVALEIANLAGVAIDQTSFSTLPTTTIKKPGGYTYRQAIGLIAQFEGGFANFNRDGKLQVRRLASTTFTITPDNYQLKGFTKNETTYRPNGIVVRTGDEESDVLKVGATSGNIIELENKVMTQALLNTVWNRVKDISYFPYEVKWQGNPNLEAGDWFYIVDREGNRYSVPNLSFSFNYNGGMSAESKATTTSNSEVTYRYRGTLKQQIEEIKGVLEGANGWNSNYYDSETEPSNPKIGDLWFKKNGADNEIWIYRLVDGVAKWELEISSAPNQELLDAIQEAIDASNVAKQAGEEAKEAGERAEQLGNEAKQAGEEAKQVGIEAKAEAELARQAGEEAKAAGQRAESLAGQAKTESATAITNANNAVSKANQAVEDSGFSKTQAQDAKQLADEAKQDALNAVSQSDTAKQIAESASSAASGAVNTANQAKQDALDAIGQAGTAITDAQAALAAYNNMEIGGRNWLLNSNREFTDTTIGVWWSQVLSPVLLETMNAKTGDEITFSVYLKVPQTALNGVAARITTYREDGTYIVANGNIIPVNSEGVSSVTFKIINDSFHRVVVGIQRQGADGTGANYVVQRKEEMLTKGNVVLDWTPAPEDVQVQISTINGELSQKVSQTTFNTLQGTVSNQGTQINQNKTDITLKANQSTVNTLTGRVSTAEGQITTQAGQISQRLTSAQVESLVNGKGYATQTSVNSQVSTINGKLNEHTSQLQTVTATVDGMQFGGRNLIKDSSRSFELVGTGTHVYKIIYTGLKRNTTYTFSSKVTVTKGSADVISVYPYLSAGNNMPTIHVPIVNGKIVTTFTTDNRFDYNLLVYSGKLGETTGINVKFEEYQLEEGNQATAWSPAFEDYSTVAEVTSKTNAIDQRISENENRITAVVGTTSTQGSKITSLESKLTLAEGAITTTNTKVTSNTTQIGTLQSSFSGLQSTVSSVRTDLDNLDIGGRNWFLNSYKNFVNSNVAEYWSVIGAEILFETMGLEAGDDVTFSVYIKVPTNAPAGVSARINFYRLDNTYTQKAGNIILPGSEGVSSVTFKVPSSSNPFTRVRLGLQRQDADGTGNIFTVQRKEEMLTKGNVVLDWTPAPEDNTSVTEFSDFKQDVNGFKQTVSSTYAKQTALNTVEQTVNSTTQTIATIQTDLSGKATVTSVNSIKNTVDSHTQTIQAHNGRITTAQQTADGAKSTATDAQGRVATVETKVTGLQTTVADKADKSQITQLSGQITSTITSLNNLGSSGNNLLLNGGFESDALGWTGVGEIWKDATSHPVYSGRKCLIRRVEHSKVVTYNQFINLIPNHKYEISYWYKTSSDYNGVEGENKLRLGHKETGDHLVSYGWSGAQTSWTQMKRIYPSPTTKTDALVTFHFNNTVGWAMIDDISIIDVTDREAAQSQITQLSNEIDLRVTKAGLIGQINTQAGKVLLRANDNVLMVTPTTTYIQDATIKTAHIADLAVTNAKIGNLSVNEGKIANAAITTLKVADAAISNAKIANLAVDSAKIASLAVDTGHIKDLAVSNAKIANLAISTAKIADAAITNAKIGNLAVNNAQIADGAINDAKIQNASISSAKIISLDANKISTSSLSAISANLGDVTAGSITGVSITGGTITQSGAGGYSLKMNSGKVEMFRDSTQIMVIAPTSSSDTNKPNGATILQIPGEIFSINTKSKTNANSSAVFQVPATSHSDDIRWNLYGQGNVIKVAGINITDDAYDRTITADSSSKKMLLSSEYGVILGHRQSNGGFYTLFDGKYTNIDLHGGGDAYFANNGAGISFGRDGGTNASGNRIWSKALYNRTYSGAANMFITSEGTLGRVTSALKYKTDVRVANDVIQNARNLLSIQPKSWLDKTELADKGSSKRYYGFIADEFDEAGLTYVVQYGNDGEVEGLAYDRITAIQNVILKEHDDTLQSIKKENFNRDFEIQKLKFEIQKLNMEIESLRQTA